MLLLGMLGDTKRHELTWKVWISCVQDSLNCSSSLEVKMEHTMEHSECEFHSMECSLKITRDITDVLKPFQEMSELLKTETESSL